MLCTIYTITFSISSIADVANAGSGANCATDYVTVSIHFIIQIRYDCMLRKKYETVLLKNRWD